MIDLSTVELLFGHEDEETALLVDDYPYGRRVRTQIRYWLETVPRKGDRFVSQTLNPKTGRWNKPKRSTYVPVGLMYREPGTGYVRWTGLATWPKEEDFANLARNVGAEQLRSEQKRSLARTLGLTRAFSHVTWEIRKDTLSDEERAEDAEQKAILAKVYALAELEARKSHRLLTEPSR